MSYGSPPTWISSHTYSRLFSKLRNDDVIVAQCATTPAAKSEGQQSSAPLPVLFISGRIEQPGDKVTLNTVYQIPMNTVLKEGSGSYALELQRADGQVLSRRRFNPIRATEEEPGVFLHFFFNCWRCLLMQPASSLRSMTA